MDIFVPISTTVLITAMLLALVLLDYVTVRHSIPAERNRLSQVGLSFTLLGGNVLIAEFIAALAQLGYLNVHTWPLPGMVPVICAGLFGILLGYVLSRIGANQASGD
jgi:hypothetical protein